MKGFNTAFRAGLCALGLMSAPTLALAQGQDETNRVTVTIPDARGPVTGIHLGRVEDTALSANVAYGDLDLRTRDGVRALRIRVADAADGLCAKLEFRYPIGEPDRATCTWAATREALGEVRGFRGLG